MSEPLVIPADPLTNPRWGHLRVVSIESIEELNAVVWAAARLLRAIDNGEEVATGHKLVRELELAVLTTGLTWARGHGER